MYPLLIERLKTAEFEDMRFVLECIDAQVEVGPSGVTVSLAVPNDPPGVQDAVPTRPRAEWVGRTTYEE
jgi:hypothetical protein